VGLLNLGLALWIAAHMLAPAFPESRAALNEKLGAQRARGAIAGAIFAGLVLMVIGYRTAPYEALFTPPGWTLHLNNLLMLMGGRTLADLTSTEGKEKLRQEALTEVQRILQDFDDSNEIEDLYFTSFVVQ